jgi:asparagine synthase (glutamine-hydrolysing)
MSATVVPNLERPVGRRAYGDLVPTAVIDRPKSGMRVPVHSWFQADLRRAARALLSPRAVRRAGIFYTKRVRDVAQYRTGRDGPRLWMLVTFEYWRRFALEGESL